MSKGLSQREKFILGKLSYEESTIYIHSLTPEEQEKLFDEISFEGAIQSSITVESSEKISDENWDNFVQNAIETEKNAPSNIKPFNNFWRYSSALAALFLVAIGVYFLISFTKIENSNLQITMDESTRTQNSEQSKGLVTVDRKSKLPSVDSKETTVHEYVLPTVPTTKVNRPLRRVIVLNKVDHLICEEKGIVSINHESLEKTLITQPKGTVLYSINSIKNRRFTVTTPHSRVTVAGTIFKVSVDTNYTQVTVFEGAVELISQQGELDTIRGGARAKVNHTSMMAQRFATLRIAKDRHKLFTQYIDHFYKNSFKDLSYESPQSELQNYSETVLQSIPKSESLQSSLFILKAAQSYQRDKHFTQAINLFYRLYKEVHNKKLREFALLKALSLATAYNLSEHIVKENIKQLHTIDDITLKKLAYELLIVTFLKQGEVQNAYPLLKEYVSVHNRSSMHEYFLYCLGQISVKEYKDYKEAISYYSELISQYPQGPYKSEAESSMNLWLLQRYEKNKNKFSDLFDVEDSSEKR